MVGLRVYAHPCEINVVGSRAVQTILSRLEKIAPQPLGIMARTPTRDEIRRHTSDFFVQHFWEIYPNSFVDQNGFIWLADGSTLFVEPMASSAFDEARVRSIFLQSSALNLAVGHAVADLTESDVDLIIKNSTYPSIPIRNSDGKSTPIFTMSVNVNDIEYGIYDIALLQKLNQRLDFVGARVFEGYLEEVLKTYKERLKISKAQVQRLNAISLAMKSRSASILSWSGSKSEGVGDFYSGILVVESNDGSEKLPLEVLHGLNIRSTLNISDSVGIVEVGRHIRNRDAGRLSDLNYLFQLTMAAISSRSKVQYAVLEADEQRRRLWEKMGFKSLPIVDSERASFYPSKTDFILYAEVQTLLDYFF